MMSGKVIVIAGPAGSGKDSIIRELVARYPKFSYVANATTRKPRAGEVDGINYHFFSEDQFKEELAKGNIPEHYFREVTGTYYGTYKPDIDGRIADGKIAVAQVQIVGAKYLKENYGATTFFIMPSQSDEFEKRIRSRAPMSDAEWAERVAHTKREIEEDAPFYDYRIRNDDGKLSEAVDEVVAILQKEGFEL